MRDNAMMDSLDYLNKLKSHLRLDSGTEDGLIQEIQDHIVDKSLELKDTGFSEEEAAETAVQSLGSYKLIARQIYEVYSQGSWRTALFAALPHFLIAALFALRWWYYLGWLLALLLAVVITVIYGWWRGKPAWLFPWLGYMLSPVVMAGVLLIYLPANWVWFAALVYVPLAVLILISITRQTLKRDWLFISLMLLPIPIVLGWAIVLSAEISLFGYELIPEFAPWIALSFAILALTVTIFIRAKQRWLKTGALLTPEILILIIVATASKNVINFWGWLLLVLVGLMLLLIPALLERRIRGKRAEQFETL